MGVQLVLSRTSRIAIPQLEQARIQCLIAVRRRSQQVNIILRRRWIVYLSCWWSRSMESLRSSGFLGCPLDHLALWRLICHNYGGSRSFHQFLQWRRSRSHSWNRARWLVVYKTPVPIQARRVKFNILKRSIRMVSRGIGQAVFWREIANYLSIRSKFSI